MAGPSSPADVSKLYVDSESPLNNILIQLQGYPTCTRELYCLVG